MVTYFFLSLPYENLVRISELPENRETLLDFKLSVRGFHLEDDLLGGLGLLVEDGLGLTTVTGLLSVVTSSTLAEWRLLALLILSHLEVLVLARSRAIQKACK